MTHKEGIHADIERAVLHNAVKYGGKADFKAVLGTILQLHPEKKAELASLRDEVEAASFAGTGVVRLATVTTPCAIRDSPLIRRSRLHH